MPHRKDQLRRLPMVRLAAYELALARHAALSPAWDLPEWDELMRRWGTDVRGDDTVPGAGGDAAAFPLSIHLMGPAKCNHAVATRVLLAYELSSSGIACLPGPGRAPGTSPPGLGPVHPLGTREAEIEGARHADVAFPSASTQLVHSQDHA